MEGKQAVARKMSRDRHLVCRTSRVMCEPRVALGRLPLTATIHVIRGHSAISAIAAMAPVTLVIARMRLGESAREGCSRLIRWQETSDKQITSFPPRSPADRTFGRVRDGWEIGRHGASMVVGPASHSSRPQLLDIALQMSGSYRRSGGGQTQPSSVNRTPCASSAC
jgi:hypothetical protein